MKTAQQGSTIGIVLIAALALGLVAASVVELINFQRNMAIRRELQFQANNAAETAMDYAFAYVANDVKRNSVTTSEYIPTGDTKYKEFDFGEEAQNFLTGSISAASSYTDPTSRVAFSNLAVRVMQQSGAQTFTVKSSVSCSRFSDLEGQIVFETTVPVVARASASLEGGKMSYTSYIQKQMAFDEVPMFQKAITYQGQLHLHRGYPILGGVHTNGNLAINAQSGDTAVYNGMVTCAGRFYRGSSFDVGGTGADPYGYCPENSDSEFDFRTIYSENISLVATNTTSLKIITSDPTDSTITATYQQLATNFDSRMTDWKSLALSTFKGNLMDKSHDVAVMLPPGCVQYRLDDAQTSAVNEFTNGTYVLLHPNITDASHPAYNQDNIYQFARKATLLFRVECLADYKGDNSADTTEQTYKWVVKAYKKYEDDQNDTNWIPLPMPSGVIGQTQMQTKDSSNAQYKIATNVIDTTKVAGGNAANPYLEGLFEEFQTAYYSTTTPYIIDNNIDDSGLVISSVSEATSASPVDTSTAKNWSVVTTTGMGSLNTSGGKVTGFAYPSATYTIVPDTSNALLKDSSTKYYYTAQQSPAHGFFDARLGRGVSPITINMSRLKEVLDGTCTDTTEAAAQFRTLLGVGGDDYNGLIYVEFPTSLKTVTTASKRCYKSGTTTPYTGDVTAVDSYAFAIGDSTAIETRHPDRMADTDTRAARTDNILPIYKTLRGYPSSYTDAEISKAKWAIPALVLVNGRQLPTITGVTGLTISTNAPLYLIGSYNSDGDFSTGTNITGTKPTDYATDDSGEVSAGLFSDTLTILSDSWGKPGSSTKTITTGSGKSATTTKYTVIDGNVGKRFKYSFGGTSGYSSSYRKVADGQVEISACILTGEYPIFEFFLHALEDWSNYYNQGGTKNSPICIKGAVVGMFHSEIQHIKGAYGRDTSKDIQIYYTGHGAFAIPAVRLHQRLTKGIFPPGTPMARDYGQQSFQFLRPTTPADAVTLSEAGF